MFSDSAQPHPSSSDTPDSGLRFGTMLAEIWHEWFEAMSEACEFFAEYGGHSNGRYGPFESHFSRSPSEGWDGSIDMDKLKQCLQPMDPIQAARVMHAVQMMQAMEAMLTRQRSRANQAAGAAW
jgi:hypothetical protein